MRGVKHKKRKRVTILKGGPSAEHEVSLKSARNVARGLNRGQYEPTEILITKGGEWEVPIGQLKKDFDIAFIAMHGAYGEDGTLQSILDAEGIPYTGSGALSSALAMNKFLTGRLLQDVGVPTPRTYLLSKTGWQGEVPRLWDWVRYFAGYPVVVKPNNSGSSVGVSFANTKDELVQALDQVFRLSREALVQPYIEGREVTCVVLDRGIPKSQTVLLPTEIIPQASRFFDYKAKYDPQGALEITPARIPESFTQLVQRLAVAAHTLVGAKGFSRTDMILGRDGTVHVLEINTIPGLTTESLLPKAAEASGIPFDKLLDRIIEASLRE